MEAAAARGHPGDVRVIHGNCSRALQAQPILHRQPRYFHPLRASVKRSSRDAAPYKEPEAELGLRELLVASRRPALGEVRTGSGLCPLPRSER